MKTISCYSSVNNLSVIFILHLFSTATFGGRLAVTYSRVKLPLADHAHRVFYDGKDDVYLFGGSNLNYRKGNRILRYSLSDDSIHWIRSLPVSAAYGSLHSDWDGNIFYFGADHDEEDKVIKYDPTTKSSSVVATLPRSIYIIPTIKVDNTVLILGGSGSTRGILSFDLAHGTSSTLDAQLPPLNVDLHGGGAIKFGKHKAFLFPINGESMWEMDLQGWI